MSDNTKVKTAKVLLRELQDRLIQEAFEAKQRGELVGWSASNFPQEITTAMGIPVVYPENMGAAVGAKGGGERMCAAAENLGFSNDLCSYARINFAYADLKKCEELEIAMPDFLLCCNNICNLIIKWYENLARMLNIPLILVDIPHNDEYCCDEDRIRYIRAQFDDCIRRLEELTGKKMDYQRLQEVMETSQRSSRAWLRAVDYMANTPSPFSGFDVFNNMAVACVGRGDTRAAELFEQLGDEYDALVKRGETTFKGTEKYRILFEGIACFPALRYTYKTLLEQGVNLTATIYGPSFSFLYQNLDELMAAYSYIPNCNCFEREVDMRVHEAQKNHIDGAIFHINRSCKKWSGNLYEMARELTERTGVPSVCFDGDQADPRAFSEEQFAIRVQGLVEIMEQNKREKKEAAENA